MKVVSFIVLILVISVAVECKKPTEGHNGQKKQFVNYGDEAGGDAYGNSFQKSGFGSYGGNEGIQGMFGGGGDEQDEMGGGGGYGGGGGMQLSETNLGGLNVGRNGMDSLAAMLGGGGGGQFSPDTYGGNDGLPGGLVQGMARGPDEQSSFEAQSDQSMSSLGGYGQGLGGGGNRGESLFSSMDGSNDENDDILSPLDANSLEGKLEHSINLGDNINTPGVGQFDMSALDEFDNAKGNSGLNNGLDGVTFQGDSPQSIKQHKGQHKTGDDRQELLSSELGELDTSDDKLQKMLESGLNGDSSSTASSNSATSALNALLSGQSNTGTGIDQMDTQQSANDDAMFAGTGSDATTTQQQTALNQLSGSMTPGNQGNYQPVTVHAHASDKPGSDSRDAPPPEESRQTAQQAQDTATKQHLVKLKRLKSRLSQLREKLHTLQDEQEKKSSSNKNNDPKTARNDAIKKLLIKNLKLAAMIASKEIQLEEAKGKGLSYLSGKKEEVDADLIDDVSHSKQEQGFHIKSKPLTELSKKAEEEVNHLSRNPDNDKKLNSSVTSVENQKNKLNNNTINNKNLLNNTSVNKEGRNTFLNRINETLQVLDKSTPEVKTRSTLTESSKQFLKKLEKQISSMSPPAAHAVEEKALATLYQAIKSKAVNAAKRRMILRQKLRESLHSKNLKRVE